MSTSRRPVLSKKELRSRSRFELTTAERWWRDRQVAFEARGYLLRPRFRPGWQPSWLEKNAKEKDPIFSEDSLFLPHSKTIDATRLSDSKTVYMKKVAANSTEVSIARYLSSTEKLQDPCNHCVQILDYFDDEAEPNVAFLVMPLLRRFDDPPFHSVDEVIGFIRQTLAGLSFMHANGVAHRDCSLSNIMMDGKKMYPNEFHSTHQYRTKSSGDYAAHRERRDVIPQVVYHFTDFGISTRFRNPEEPKLVTGAVCQDHEVPELSDIVPYNPFAVDVFLLGNVYKKTFINEFINVAFLEPLVRSMTQVESTERPHALEALTQFEEIVMTQDKKNLQRRLKRPNIGRTASFFMDVSDIWRESTFKLKENLRTTRLLH